MLGTPPAFVLSQDQTLRQDLSPAPEPKLVHGTIDRFEEPGRSPRPVQLASSLSFRSSEEGRMAQMLELTVVRSATDPVTVRTPALAFTVLCSVFKERRAHEGAPKRSHGGAVSCSWCPTEWPIHR